MESKTEKNQVDHPRVVSSAEWLAARIDLLKAEKELTRRSDELARRRQELPWVRIDKEYRFETDEGSASLADLFRGRSQLLVYHYMFGPDYAAGCATCSTFADGFNGFVVHLANHDVLLWAVSRAPLAKLHAYKQRMGWTFPWASSFGSDFNLDFNVSFTEEQQRKGAIEYNYERGHAMDETTTVPQGVADNAVMAGTDAATYTRERPGMSAFALENGIVYHTYSTYSRGLDGLWGMYQWLERSGTSVTVSSGHIGYTFGALVGFSFNVVFVWRATPILSGRTCGSRSVAKADARLSRQNGARSPLHLGSSLICISSSRRWRSIRPRRSSKVPSSMCSYHTAHFPSARGSSPMRSPARARVTLISRPFHFIRPPVLTCRAVHSLGYSRAAGSRPL